MKKITYVTGMPRANTTLLCNILANNKRIVGGETSPLLEYLFGARGNFSSTVETKSALTEDIMYQSFLNFCREGMKGYAEYMCKQKDGSEIYLDKSRGWLHYSEFLKEFYPEAKIIVLVRDIRAVLSSFEKKWRENPSIMDNRDSQAQQNFITIESRVNYWLNDPPLGIALRRLINAIQTKTINNMLVVRAEDLAKNPEYEMRRIYEYIGEPYFEMDYSNVKQMTVENDRVADYGIYGDHKIRPNVEPFKNDYNDILGSVLCNNIKANYNWFYQEFKYF